jgi:hypothetical protein
VTVQSVTKRNDGIKLKRPSKHFSNVFGRFGAACNLLYRWSARNGRLHRALLIMLPAFIHPFGTRPDHGDVAGANHGWRPPRVAPALHGAGITRPASR